MTPRTPPEIEEFVVREYLAGTPVQEIADRAGINWGTIYLILPRYGVEPAGQIRAPYNPDPYIIPSLNSTWATEFRGFFYADGCAKYVRTKHTNKAGKRYYLYRPELNVQQRDDNWKLMEDIQAHLGGYLYPIKGSYKKSHPCLNWVLTGYSPARTILEEVLLDGVLPARKREDIAFLYEVILARWNMPRRFCPENRAILEEFYQSIKAFKRYQGSGG